MLDACGLESGSEKEAEMKSMQNSTVAGSAMQGITGTASSLLASSVEPTLNTHFIRSPWSVLSHLVELEVSHRDSRSASV